MTTASLTIDSSGTLQIGNGGTVGSISGNVINNGSLQVDRSDSVGAINANVSGSGSVTLIGSGTVTFAGSNSYSGSTNIDEGSLVIRSTSALSTHSAINNDSSLSIQTGTSAVPVTAASLSGTGVLIIGAGSKVGYLVLSANGQIDQQSTVIVNNGSTLDLTNNKFFVNYGTNPSPVGGIAAELASGYSGGLWNGIGIISSTVAAENISQSALVYSVGYADGADGIVTGLSSGQIEILPTLAGDAKLQGQVVFGDFQLLSQYFGSAGSWDEGNFSYGSAVKFGDFQLLSQNFGESSAAVLQAASSTATAAGPIPSTKSASASPSTSLSTSFVSSIGSTPDESLLEDSDALDVL
jgi:autotransporter-associated beta strand protein